LDGSRGPQSTGSTENVPSPDKRPRLEDAPFNGQQEVMLNGKGQPQGIPVQPLTPANCAIYSAEMPIKSGVSLQNLTLQQFEDQSQVSQALQNYTKSQHHQCQMPNNNGMPNPGGPQGEGSYLVIQDQDRGNHALQDDQMQLILLEQQNKKRLMRAHQEQDSMGVMPRDGPGGRGPNDQPFQGASPQGGRTGTSPNLIDLMKRGTPQFNPAGIPPPLPDGQGRGLPGAMNFMPGQMDPTMAPHFYQMGGMDDNMIGPIPNGMPSPSSHPANLNGQMNQQMMEIAWAQQQKQQVIIGVGTQANDRTNVHKGRKRKVKFSTFGCIHYRY
jgi:hypothetical protein